MKWCWFSLSAFTMSPHPISTLAPAAHLFFVSLSHFYASVLWLALSRCLISFVLIPCLSPVLHFSLTLACSLLYHTLILSDVKLIALPLFLPASLPLAVPLWCESDYGGWRIRWFVVCVCVCGSDDDGMLRDRWKVRCGARLQTEASVCHLLSAVFSTGCVIPV